MVARCLFHQNEVTLLDAQKKKGNIMDGYYDTRLTIKM